MSEDWVIITKSAEEKLRIGELIETREYGTITDKWLKKYALSLRDTNPLYLDDEYAEKEGRFGYRIAPSAFCVVLNPMERGCCPASAFWAELWGRPDDGKCWGGHAAYNRFEYEKPIRVGDRLRCEIRNRKCYEKHGKRGVLVAVETDYTLIDQQGETVALCTYGNMSQFPFPESGSSD